MPIYISNIQSIVDKYANGLENIIDRKLMVKIAEDLVANNIERIHNDGKSVDGSVIGQYDTGSEIYVNPKNSPKKGGLKIAGKYGDTKFKNGKPHKTSHNKNYKDFRNKIGRRIDKVDLNLSGKLSKEFTLQVVSDNQVNIGFNTKYGTELAKGHEQKYNKEIWGVSKSDEILIEEIVIDKINRILNA